MALSPPSIFAAKWHVVPRHSKVVEMVLNSSKFRQTMDPTEHGFCHWELMGVFGALLIRATD